MITILKRFIPKPVKKVLRLIIKYFKYKYRYWLIKIPVRKNKLIKIIVGAAETYRSGWYSTNEQWLDITSESDWNRVFGGKCILTHVVAEHVFEHLTEAQCKKALRHIFDHLVIQGHLRIAVPDGYNPNQEYLRNVGIQGIGDDAADHKQLLNVDKLCFLLEQAGFKTNHIEGYNEKGELIHKDYDVNDGFIRRSRSNEPLGKNSPWNFPDSNTSLIVDGIKIGT